MPAVINKSTDAAGLAKQPQKFYDRTMLARLLPNLLYPIFGQSKPMPQKQGVSVQWRGFDSLPAATTGLSEGVTPDGSALTMNTLEATPKQYGDFVKLTDVVDVVSFDPVLTETAELLGEQAANTYDLLVRDVITAGTNAMYVGAGSTQTSHVQATDVITTDVVRLAVRTFQSAKIKPLTSILNATDGVGTTPVPACFVGIISAKTLYDMKKETNGGFIPVHKYPSQVSLMPGEVGAIDSVRFVMSDNAKVKVGAGQDANDVHCTLLIGQNAYGIVSLDNVTNIVKDYGSGDDPLNQRMTSGWKAFFTAVRLQELAILRIEHGVTA